MSHDYIGLYTHINPIDVHVSQDNSLGLSLHIFKINHHLL